MPATIRTCAVYYLVQPGDDCNHVTQRFGISLNDFYTWNPMVKGSGDCQNLWLGYFVCAGLQKNAQKQEC